MNTRERANNFSNPSRKVLDFLGNSFTVATSAPDRVGAAKDPRFTQFGAVSLQPLWLALDIGAPLGGG
jgi:hypothetical protein